MALVAVCVVRLRAGSLGEADLEKVSDQDAENSWCGRRTLRLLGFDQRGLWIL